MIKNSNIQFYGSFIHSEKIPNALFFFDNVAKNDSFELRRALRNHEIDTIVLGSNGGSVWEALTMAGIIFDKRMTTYVPKASNKGCFSACTFMFFAGHNRRVNGPLGVHQMGTYSETGDQRKTEIGKAEQSTQFAVSEIIGFLNEFDTPRFVLERMFRSREMYVFDEEEISKLEAGIVPDELIYKINVFTLDLIKYLEKSLKEANKRIPFVEDKGRIKLFQAELNRVGCRAGVADGIWGRQTYAAAERFAQNANLSFAGLEAVDELFLQKLETAKAGHCPAPPRRSSRPKPTRPLSEPTRPLSAIPWLHH
jgi:hypothetical protein